MYAKLLPAWRARCELYTEADKLYAEGTKLWAESTNLRAESAKLWAEGDKLWAEADKLYAEGDKLWANAVAEVCGSDCTVELTDEGCVVAGVMLFLI